MIGADVDAVRAAAIAGCDGVVLRWVGQSLLVDRSGAFLVGVLCDDADGATQAVAEGAHFLVIAPEDGPLSERLLERLCVMIGRPSSLVGIPTRGASSVSSRSVPTVAPSAAETRRGRAPSGSPSKVNVPFNLKGVPFVSLKVAVEEIQDRLPAMDPGVAEAERAVTAARIGHELEGLPARDQRRDQERRVGE